MQWQHTRAVLTMLWNVNVAPKHQMTPAEYMPLPTDPPAPGMVPPDVMLAMIASAFNLPITDEQEPDR